MQSGEASVIPCPGHPFEPDICPCLSSSLHPPAFSQTLQPGQPGLAYASSDSHRAHGPDRAQLSAVSSDQAPRSNPRVTAPPRQTRTLFLFFLSSACSPSFHQAPERVFRTLSCPASHSAALYRLYLRATTSSFTASLRVFCRNLCPAETELDRRGRPTPQPGFYPYPIRLRQPAYPTAVGVLTQRPFCPTTGPAAAPAATSPEPEPEPDVIRLQPFRARCIRLPRRSPSALVHTARAGPRQKAEGPLRGRRGGRDRHFRIGHRCPLEPKAKTPRKHADGPRQGRAVQPSFEGGVQRSPGRRGPAAGGLEHVAQAAARRHAQLSH